MLVLKLLHWFVALMIWISSLFVPNKYLSVALFIQLITMISWLVSNRCILWDVQKATDPTFVIKKDTTPEMLGIKDRNTWLQITHTMVYLNTMYLGFRMNKLHEIMIFLTIYILLNRQYLHRGDDDLSKYD